MVITNDELRRWKYQLRLHRKALEASIPCIKDPVVLDAVLAYLMGGTTTRTSKVLVEELDIYIRESLNHIDRCQSILAYASTSFVINELEYYRKAIRTHLRKQKQATKKPQ